VEEIAMGTNVSDIDTFPNGQDDLLLPMVDDPDVDGTDDESDDEIVADSPKNDAPESEDDEAEIPVPA